MQTQTIDYPPQDLGERKAGLVLEPSQVADLSATKHSSATEFTRDAAVWRMLRTYRCMDKRTGQGRFKVIAITNFKPGRFAWKSVSIQSVKEDRK
jgi:hypothetical protein